MVVSVDLSDIDDTKVVIEELLIKKLVNLDLLLVDLENGALLWGLLCLFSDDLHL